MEAISKKLTLGRLLIVGIKSIALQKSVIAQKAAFGASKNHLVEKGGTPSA